MRRVPPEVWRTVMREPDGAGRTEAAGGNATFFAGAGESVLMMQMS